MKSNIVLILAIIVVLLSCIFTGCGVSQEEYDRVNAELRTSQTRVAELQKEYDKVNAELGASQTRVAELQKEYDKINAEIRTSQTRVAELQEEYDRLNAEFGVSQRRVAELQSETGELREQYEIVGETPVETAENIVRRYHETHIYSKVDFFVCSDMALDVWNMLKAQGINALIQIGNVDVGVEDIAEANHAWVLAEVSPGHYLALETTGGYVVQDNALYYRGWSFDNPKEYKKYEELRREWNLRVDIFNQLISDKEEIYEEYNEEYAYYKELLDEFNSRYAGRPVSSESQAHEDKIETQLAIVKEKEGRYNQLRELIDEQDGKMENIASEMRGLTN